MTSIKRIQNELKQCQSLEGVDVQQDPSNQMIWNITLNGPQGSPFQGGKFKAQIEFPAQYPFKFPNVKFITPMFHPNIDKEGELCKEMIGEKEWIPTKKVAGIIQTLQSFLTIEGITDSAINNDAYDLYKKNQPEFEKKVREYTQKYAQ